MLIPWLGWRWIPRVPLMLPGPPHRRIFHSRPPASVRPLQTAGAPLLPDSIRLALPSSFRFVFPRRVLPPSRSMQVETYISRSRGQLTFFPLPWLSLTPLRRAFSTPRQSAAPRNRWQLIGRATFISLAPPDRVLPRLQGHTKLSIPEGNAQAAMGPVRAPTHSSQSCRLQGVWRGRLTWAARVRMMHMPSPSMARGMYGWRAKLFRQISRLLRARSRALSMAK